LLIFDKRIRNIFKDNDFVQNENSKSLIEADKRIRNIFKDIDSEDRAGGCGSSPQGIDNTALTTALSIACSW
jgi:hypothetical protein